MLNLQGVNKLKPFFFRPVWLDTFGEWIFCQKWIQQVQRVSYLVVSTHLKKISQIGSIPPVRVKIENIWVATNQNKSKQFQFLQNWDLQRDLNNPQLVGGWTNPSEEY